MTSLYICNMIFNITEREAVDHDNFAFSERNKLYQYYYYRLLNGQNILPKNIFCCCIFINFPLTISPGRKIWSN